jgi:uncharacterized protein (TIGR02246 family)
MTVIGRSDQIPADSATWGESPTGTYNSGSNAPASHGEVGVSEVEKLIEAQVAAYRERDLERFLGFYAVDVSIRDFEGNVLMDGVDAMRAQYDQLFRDSPTLKVQIPRRMMVGDFVIDEEVITGFILPGYPSEMHAVVVYRVENGKIQEVVFLS